MPLRRSRRGDLARRVSPVGARASGSGTTEPRNAAEVSAADTFTSVRGRNCHRRNALAFARTDSSSSAPPSTKSKTGRGVSLRAVAHRSAMSWQAESRLRVASSSAGFNLDQLTDLRCPHVTDDSQGSPAGKQPSLTYKVSR